MPAERKRAEIWLAKDETDNGAYGADSLTDNHVVKLKLSEK